MDSGSVYTTSYHHRTRLHSLCNLVSKHFWQASIEPSVDRFVSPQTIHGTCERSSWFEAESVMSASGAIYPRRTTQYIAFHILL